MRTRGTNPLSSGKIKSIAQLSVILPGLKAEGKKIVFTNGCFDILHLGHVRYLEKAKQSGDILIVALNTDSSIRRIKGDKRPIIPEMDRAGIVAGLTSVDYTVLFNEDTPLNTIKTLKPDIIVKGSDWSEDKIVGADFVRSYGGKVRTIRLIKGRSTTNFIEKIVARFCKEKSL